jgi:hypothetical protein
LRRTMKNLKNYRISLLLGSIKCFPISFSTFKTLQVAPWWSWYHKLPIKNNFFYFPAQGCPLVAEEHSALLIMPIAEALHLVFLLCTMWKFCQKISIYQTSLYFKATNSAGNLL